MDQKEATTSAAVRRLSDVPALPPHAPGSLVDAWELARSGAALERDEEARALAVLDHPEFYVLWEHEDDLPAEIDLEVGGVNPRLHIALHQVVEKQLLAGDPPEVAETVVTLMRMGISRHRALHLVLEGLSREIWDILRERRPADMDRFRQHLARLRSAQVATRWAVRSGRPGRNDPCPCGSGKKYKRCCGEAGATVLTNRNGKMILGSGFIASHEYLLDAADTDRVLGLENLAAVARWLADFGPERAAMAAFRQLAEAAEATGEDDYVYNALQDLLFFTQEHPRFAREGIRAAHRLAGMTEDPGQAALYQLDAAELHESLGEREVADAIFREVMAGHPPDGACHLRWARRLARAGQVAEAEAAYRGVLARKDPEFVRVHADALEELADLLEATGRVAAAADLRRRAR